MKNIFGYKKALKREKIYRGSRSNRVKQFIDSDKGAEYIVFGPLFSQEIEPEREKLDVAQGGEDLISSRYLRYATVRI